ncbi:hypothetical protein M378DRAFT_180090 [Amanita muscaria Koide BX008]|uniref:F-box domain-containing protein n=1 Tax=Amanita muscaria (strain Koide BX008) TaxID=946122 RepID=A0A0C2T496_AMAMK|nr:hypothetical protein M378DRAFT_180090 [Amanita muscaria Koide BX008]
MVSFNEDMPTEILTQILNNLDLFSMVQCRAVCSRFLDLIDLSPHFHWKVELTIAGKEDGENYPLATRRKMLEQHQQGWADLRWTTERRIPIQFDSLWELCGDVFAHSSTDRSEIRFKQIPSHSRNLQDRDWMVEVKEYRVDDIAIDPAQDLLVILEELPVSVLP